MVSLDESRWAEMPLIEQMANIGSEVGRTVKWVSKGKRQMAENSFERALDIIDLTIKCGRLRQNGRLALLEELCRARELFCGAFLTSDIDNLSYLDKYFWQFALAFQNKKTGLQAH